MHHILSDMARTCNPSHWEFEAKKHKSQMNKLAFMFIKLNKFKLLGYAKAPKPGQPQKAA